MLARHQGKRIAKLLAGFLLSAILLVAFFYNTDWAAVSSAVAGAHLGLIGVTLTGNIASFLLRSARWRLLLASLRPDVPLWRAWRFFMIGFAVSAALPGRLGEVVRPYLLGKDQRLPFAATFATVVVERVIDLVSVLVILGSAFLFPAVLGPASADPSAEESIALIRSFGLAALCLAAGALGTLAALRARPRWALASLRRVTRRAPPRWGQWVEGRASEFVLGLSKISGMGRMAALAGFTVAIWLVIGAATWACLAAFSILVPFHHALFLLAVLALGVVVPTPAGVGTYHAGAIVVVGGLWGLSASRGGAVAAFALVSHLVAYAPIVIIGGYYLLRDGVRIFSVTGQVEQERS